MVERIVFYSSIAQRDSIKATAYAIGESPIHDDFIDSNGDPTDGTSGRLTFDIIAPTVPDADDILLESLLPKVEAETLTLPEVNQFLRLKFIAGK